MTTPPSPSKDVEEDSIRHCIRCGYALRGLSLWGVCPECAEPIANSIRGDRLEFSLPEYVAGLHRGVRLVMWSIVLLLIAIIGGLACFFLITGLRLGQLVEQVAAWTVFLGIIVSHAISIAGWLLMTRQDPAERGDKARDGTRQAARTAVLANAFFTVMSILFGWTRVNGTVFVVDAHFILLALLVVVAGIQFFVTMRYLQRLAPRLPSERAVWRSRRLVWLGPVLLTVGAALAGVGPLIAMVLYWELLDCVRQALERCIVAQTYERTS